MELNVIVFIFLFSCCYGYRDKQKKDDFTGSENMKIFLDKLEENLLKKFDIDPKDLSQTKNQNVKIPKYVEKLYEVMSEREELGRAIGDPMENGVTTIHMHKPAGRIHRDRVVKFQLKSEILMKNNFTKAELVLENKWPKSLFNLEIVCLNDDTQKASNIVRKEEGIIADVTQCLKLDRHPTINVTFKIIAVPLKYGKRNFISLRLIRHMNPTLLTFHNFNTDLEIAVASRAKRDAFQNRLNTFNVGVLRNEVNWERAEEMGVCRLKPWFLNFADIGWHWIIAPKEYSTNICVGGCPAVFLERYLNVTNYSFLKNLFHAKQRFLHNMDDRVNNVPEACCSPVSYTSLALMHRTKHGEIVIKNLPEMRVISCGCR